ncbi:MAG: DUF202 domain-containing protein [Arthrobacter sp.]
MREPAWRKTGSTPGYRFSLANETTFLARIRTSLALIVGALGIDQLFPAIAPAPLRITLCVALACIGAALAVLAYRGAVPLRPGPGATTLALLHRTAGFPHTLVRRRRPRAGRKRRSRHCAGTLSGSSQRTGSAGRLLADPEQRNS